MKEEKRYVKCNLDVQKNKETRFKKGSRIRGNYTKRIFFTMLPLCSQIIFIKQ